MTGFAYSRLNFKAQVTSVTMTVDGAPPGTPVNAREGVEMTLECLAVRARPAVSIDWTNGGVAVPGDTEVMTENGDVSDTRSTLLFTPSKEDDGNQLTCQTAGQVVAQPQSDSISLNVQCELSLLGHGECVIFMCRERWVSGTYIVGSSVCALQQSWPLQTNSIE